MVISGKKPQRAVEIAARTKFKKGNTLGKSFINLQTGQRKGRQVMKLIKKEPEK